MLGWGRKVSPCIEWTVSDYSLLVDALLPVLVAVGGVQLLAARLRVRSLGDQRLAVPGVEVTLARDDDNDTV